MCKEPYPPSKAAAWVHARVEEPRHEDDVPEVRDREAGKTFLSFLSPRCIDVVGPVRDLDGVTYSEATFVTASSILVAEWTDGEPKDWRTLWLPDDSAGVIPLELEERIRPEVGTGDWGIPYLDLEERTRQEVGTGDWTPSLLGTAGTTDESSEIVGHVRGEMGWL